MERYPNPEGGRAAKVGVELQHASPQGVLKLYAGDGREIHLAGCPGSCMGSMLHFQAPWIFIEFRRLRYFVAT